MKKTQYEPHPQFIRERSSNMPSMPSDSQDLGYVYGKRPKNNRRKTRRLQQILIVLIILLVGTIGVIYAAQKAKGAPSTSLPSSSSSDFSLSGVDFIDEETESSETYSSSRNTVGRAAAFTTLRQALTTYAENFKGRIGIYYLNLATGETFGLNEKAPFVAASSIKLGINTLLYKNVAEGAFKFTDMLSYDNRAYPQGDMEPGTGTVIGQPNGTQFTVRRTSQLSITISDNCATNMVIRKLGGIDAIVPYLTAISSAVPYRTSVTYVDYAGATVSGRHRSSAKDLALYAQNLYQLWKASPKDYSPLMEDLESTVFTFGIQAKLPATLKVAHKIGTNGDWKTENDAGIVFAAEPYVLCVTTENPSQAAGREAVAEVSLRIYNYITEVTK
jgi:beta-lactamase class A